MPPIITFILGLGALILLHELGHFLVARLFKIEIEEFGIGFPPRMIKLFELNGTEYTLNWIPLGGFVRPKGENDPTVPGGLAAANPFARLAVLASGPIMNILVGILLGMMLFYSLGDPILDQVRIEDIAPGSPADRAGLRAGDLLVSIAGEEIDSREKVVEVINKNLDKPVELVYRRGGREFSVSLVPRSDPPPNEGAIGILMGNPTRPINLGTAMYRGAYATFENIKAILLLPVRLFEGTASPEEGRLIGYRGMYEIYTELQSPLYFFMAISISLGVMNLLPIPALDGGRILLTLPEILLRRRIPQQYENMIHLIGFTLLLLLIIYINVQDFINPIELP